MFTLPFIAGFASSISVKRAPLPRYLREIEYRVSFFLTICTLPEVLAEVLLVTTGLVGAIVVGLVLFAMILLLLRRIGSAMGRTGLTSIASTDCVLP